MKLVVTLPYKGVKRGTYDATDSALQGLAEYLVKAGHARIMSGSLTDLGVTVSKDTKDMTEHNKVMKRLGRPTVEPTEEVPQETTQESKSIPHISSKSIEKVRATYEKVLGEKADGRKSKETLIEEIEAHYGNTPNAND